MRWIRTLLWVAMAFPAALMIQRLATGEALAMELYHPSGELSVRLMILALLPGPLIDFFGPNRLLRGWVSIRRNLGVAAYGYALIHLVFYFVDMRSINAMLSELALPAIWTGWLAFLAMMVPAAISTDRAMRRLGRQWKLLQRLVYPAFILALLHWVLLDREWLTALAHLAPLAFAWLLRISAARGLDLRRKTT